MLCRWCGENFRWQKWSCAATKSLCEDQALLLRRRLPLVPRAASPHGGNLVAAVNDIWVQPLDTCDVLELCVILIIRGSLAIRRGQYRCPAIVQKEQQGIFRCRAGVGGQGSHAAMESPEALMCPLEKGVRGIEISGLLPLTGFCGFSCFDWNEI